MSNDKILKNYFLAFRVALVIMDKKKARPKETTGFKVEEKPRLTLSEFEVYDTSSNNVSGNIFGNINNKYDVKKMSSKLSIKLISLNNMDMTFDLIGFDPAIVNALRRILLSDVPSMAIEKVHMWQVNNDVSPQSMSNQ